MSNNEGNILSFIAGVAVGALVGVLVAPDAGEKTRGKLAQKSNDLLEDFEGQLEIAKHKVEQFNESLKQKTEKLQAEVAEATEKAKKKVSE
ncbi:MAG: YtxH domain-containing protein [Bernardetiaceae bacterium]|nr:YtxH domain-containing protein [Bernardetiaceae bacterium]